MGKKNIALRAMALASAVTLATPVLAFAEEERSGIQLLIPTMAEFIPACVAFLIIFVIMSKLAWPMILEMMDARENKIKGDLDSAEQSKLAAAENERVSAAKISDAQRQADEIIAAARREAEKERAEIIAKAQQDFSDIVAKGHEAVEAERKRALIDLSGSVIDLSVDIASKIIGEGMDESTQRVLAERYLAEVGSLNG